MKKSKNNRKRKKQLKKTDIGNYTIATMKQKNNPTISVCMIVKDEELFLDNCLKSVKDIADEIIIIDTGSKDKTVDIARKYTDKVYFHPWQNSFSEARNHYFEYATGDWIFQIDADEELIKKDKKTVLEAVKNPDIDAIMIQIISTYKKGEDESRHNAERIFRNNGVIHYEGRVHNRLTGIKNPQIYLIGLLHYGYDLSDAELSEKKYHRRVSLLKQDIEDTPDNPLPYHYLGCCYLPKGLYHETLDVSSKAIGLAEKHNDKNPIYLWSRYNAAMAYYQLKDYNNAELISLEAIKINDHHIDSYFILTLVNHELKKWDDVISYGKKYIELCELFEKDPDKFGILVSSTLGMDWNILVLMGIASYETGKEKKSEDFFNNAAKKPKKSFQVYRAAGLYFHSRGKNNRARIYLEKAHKINPDDSTTENILTQLNPDNSRKQTVSCCMIVKNEEEFLDKCLASVKDYVDELIIVDTGSTDSTVEIAKKYTDKIYFHPWENSFSTARNQALQYATCDWVFQIDGDEELMEGSGIRIREAIQNAGDADIIYVNIFCSYASGTKKSLHNFERLFKNNGVIHYEGSVHNQIIGGTKAFYSSIELWHYGYDVDEEKSLQKFKRTSDLLKKEIENDPENPKYHHYLSVSYFSKGMNKDALEEAKTAIRLSDEHNDNHPLYAWTHFIASMTSFTLDDIDLGKRYALKSLDKYPDHMDSYYMLAMMAAEKAEWNEVIRYGENFLGILEKHKENPGNAGLSINNTMNEGPAVCLLMGHAAYNTAEFAQMEKYYNLAHNTAENKWEVWWNIGTYHMDKTGDLEKAGHFLELAIKEAPDEYRAWYMLAKYYNKCGSANNEIIALEKVIKIGTEENFIFNRLFTLYTEKGLNDKAFTLINNINNFDSSFYHYLLKLGNSFLERGILESAFQCYMKAAEAEPDRSEAWSILAEITYSLGQYDDSQVFIEKALELKGNDASNILTMCELKLKSGDIESHVRYCDTLLECLGLDRNRAISGFSDLKNLFIEVGTYLKEDINCSSKISSIIKQLDTYNSSTGQ